MIYKRNGNWHMDVTIHSVRYREALNTGDKREALALEKKRIGDIQQGKGASKSGRDYARKAFSEAATLYLEQRKAHVAERTTQLEKERLVPLTAHFAEKPLLRFTADDIANYQNVRLEKGISGRTINMETGVVRRMLKRAKLWNVLSEDVKTLPERSGEIGRVLPADIKRKLFETAGSRPQWMVAHCAAVLAVSTTCRGVEIKNLLWQDVDLFKREVTIRRSKNSTGRRTIPLNADAMAALARLLERADALGVSEPEHFVFPACEHTIDPTRHQKSFRTSWRKLTIASGVPGFRFHDLRHQAITEMAESGASDATMMAIAGHMSKRMLEHYSHARMAAKRNALDKLESGLMGVTLADAKTASEKAN